MFEGFLPARRLPGEFFELNPTGTGLVGRRSGRSYRLGDEIEVRVESIERTEGKVELALAAGGQRTPRKPAGKTAPTKRSASAGGKKGKGKGKGSRKRR